MFKTKEIVCIYSGSSWMRWDFNSVNIGGSEIHQIALSRELDKLGYKVVCFADTPQQEIDDGNIQWFHYSKFEEWNDYNYIDYFISERTEQPFEFNVHCKKSFIQVHDVFLLSSKDMKHLDKVDKVCVLSDWHKSFVKDYHNIPEEKLIQTQNGIYLDRYKQQVEKIPNRLFYSSSLDRGLDTLLYLFPFMKAEIPDLSLYIYYGTEILEKCDPDYVKRIKEQMNQPGVHYVGKLNQQELAIEQLKSSVWVYPTVFEETWCITALEAQAAGCPVIASNYAGLKTTIGNSGILLGNGNKDEALTRDVRIKFVEETVKILKDKDYYRHYQELGYENCKKFTWENAALNWVKIFNSN
jgi:glycosyltransferase involved in cell wall biosynthesis